VVAHLWVNKRLLRQEHIHGLHLQELHKFLLFVSVVVVLAILRGPIKAVVVED
jgi:hypothetical protein